MSGVRRDNSVASLNASGAGSSVIQNNNHAVTWRVDQISVIANPTASGTTCTVTPPTGIVDTSYFAGTGDVCGGDPPIYLEPGDFLTLTWTAGPANGQGIATYYFEELM